MTSQKKENEIHEGRMSPSRVLDGEARGWIVPIGGAEEKENDPRILKRFVEICGGSEANIVVIPTASQLADTGARYEKLFTELGAGEVGVLDFDMRRDTEEKNRLQRLDKATGIFFTGGNQLRLSTMLGGTPVAQRIRALNAGGVHVGGTSAGASILSEHMIAFGKEGLSPTAGSVRLAPGLGLTNRFIIDQHFSQRDRLGRLMAALAYNPYAVGIGLDEDTAAFIRPDNTVEVEGSGSVTVLDAGNLQFSSMAQAGEHDPVCMLGVTIHVLIAGATFNMQTRHASAGTLAVPKKSE
jgi:cyanophycinase